VIWEKDDDTEEDGEERGKGKGKGKGKDRRLGDKARGGRTGAGAGAGGSSSRYGPVTADTAELDFDDEQLISEEVAASAKNSSTHKGHKLAGKRSKAQASNANAKR
jgi:hypothetical protein